MNCIRCRYDNREGIKFCEGCGAELQIKCRNCQADIPAFKSFCGECGYQVKSAKPTFRISETDSLPFAPAEEALHHGVTPLAGERKYVTALFTDMCGYTIISERLDPEEVKEMTTQIFDKISKIIRKFDGFIEKFAGDAVMALFGATVTHEDDPIRAILAAIKIHSAVESCNPRYEKRIGRPLSMHTGIDTGLVVTGDVNLERGTHGVSGPPINVAARLSALGGPGEILVGQKTYSQTGGYFVFEPLEPARIKSKAKPSQIYKVLSKKKQPIKTHRLQGVRAELIGRKAEMDKLADAYKNLKKGKRTVFLTCGAVGTGKSRLIEEFKATLDLDTVQWLEGHAYPYAQNVPYFPLIDLLKRALQIEESDPPKKIKQKIRASIEFLDLDKKDVEPYIGSLFALNYPEIDQVSPDSWKLNLCKSIEELLTTLLEKTPTIICLEDLHWADSPSLELIRFILSEFKSPAMFICAYRPIISFLNSDQKKAIGASYNKIDLQDLSSSETLAMVESLMMTDSIPDDLRRFIQDKAGGNPFYLEELINSLIESKTLLCHNDVWKITRPIDKTHISSTVHGIISSRIDRLEKNTKRIIQEASVIGGAFFY